MNDLVRINLAQELLHSVIAVASRIDAFNSRQLDQAMRRYLMLQTRDLDDTPNPDEDESDEPVDLARLAIST